jgi:hypothetical protein
VYAFTSVVIWIAWAFVLGAGARRRVAIAAGALGVAYATGAALLDINALTGPDRWQQIVQTAGIALVAQLPLVGLMLTTRALRERAFDLVDWGVILGMGLGTAAVAATVTSETLAGLTAFGGFLLAIASVVAGARAVADIWAWPTPLTAPTARAIALLGASVALLQWLRATGGLSDDDLVLVATLAPAWVVSSLLVLFPVAAIGELVAALGERASISDGPWAPRTWRVVLPMAVLAGAFLPLVDPSFVTVYLPVGFVLTFVWAIWLLRTGRTDPRRLGSRATHEDVLHDALLAEANRRARGRAVQTLVGDATSDEQRQETYERERRRLQADHERLRDTPGLALGPLGNWHANGVVGMRVGAVFAVAPMAYYLATVVQQDGARVLWARYGLMSLLGSLAAEWAFWVVAAFLLGTLLPRLPGRLGALSGLVLAALISVPGALVGWIGDSHDTGWPLRALELAVFLTLVGLALDRETLRRARLPTRTLLELYRADDLRWALAYAASAVAAIAVFAQQLISGEGIDTMVQLFQAASGFAPPER